MMDDSTVRTIALSAGYEDYAGLYELLWELSTVDPEGAGQEHLQRARRVLTQLLVDGLIEVFSATWTSNTFLAVDVALATRVLDDPDSWLPPGSEGEGAYYAFATTESGDEAYLDG